MKRTLVAEEEKTERRGETYGSIFVSYPLSLVALSSLFFSTQALLVKILGLSSVGSFEIILVRGICQALGVVSVMFFWGTPVREWLGTTSREAGLLGARGLLGFGGIAFGFLAVQMTSLSNSQVAAQTTPVFAAILSCLFLGEPWLASEMLVTLAVAAGVCLIFRPPFIFGNSDDDGTGDAVLRKDQLGIGFSIIGSFCASCAYCLIRIMGTTTKVPWPKLMLAQGIAQITLAAPSLYAARQNWTIPTLLQSGMMLGCGVLGFFGQVCMTIGMQRSKAAASSLMRQTGIVWAFAYDAALVPGEAITVSTCAGAAVITASTAWLAYSKSVRAAAEAAAEAAVVDTDHHAAVAAAGNHGSGSIFSSSSSRKRTSSSDETLESLSRSEASSISGVGAGGDVSDDCYDDDQDDVPPRTPVCSSTRKPPSSLRSAVAAAAATSSTKKSSGKYSRAALEDVDSDDEGDGSGAGGDSDDSGNDHGGPNGASRTGSSSSSSSSSSSAPVHEEFGFLWTDGRFGVGNGSSANQGVLPDFEDDPWAHDLATWGDDEDDKGGHPMSFSAKRDLLKVMHTFERLVPPSLGSSYRRLKTGIGGRGAVLQAEDDSLKSPEQSSTSHHNRRHYNHHRQQHQPWGDVPLSTLDQHASPLEAEDEVEKEGGMADVDDTDFGV